MTKNLEHPINKSQIDELKGLILPIIGVIRDKHVLHLGSGFIVGSFRNDDRSNAIIATAAHVIQWAYDIDNPDIKNHPTALKEFLPDPEKEYVFKDIELYVLVSIGENKTFAATIDWSCYDRDRDIAFCGISIPKDILSTKYSFKKVIQINTRGPHVGANVFAAGFHEIENNIECLSPMDLENGVFDFNYNINIYGGKVLELHHDYGPRHHAWPCFKTDIPFHHGMSGGPVLQVATKDNLIIACGIISSDSTSSDSSAGLEPMASIIWTSLYLKTSIKINPQLTNEVSNPNILDFIKIDVIRDVMNSSQHVFINEDDNSLPFMNWHHQNDFDTYVNKSVRSSPSGIVSRFLYVFLDLSISGKIKPSTFGQQVISYYVKYNEFIHIPENQSLNWTHFLIKPCFIEIPKENAMQNAEKLARKAYELNRDVLRLKGMALFSKDGNRVEFHINS